MKLTNKQKQILLEMSDIIAIRKENKMAGYDFNNGMSNNAVEAYERGAKPISKFKKEDFESLGYAVYDKEYEVVQRYELKTKEEAMQYIENNPEEFENGYIIIDFKKYPLAFYRYLAKNNTWRSCEYHHTSRFYNTTDFYDPEELTDIEPSDLKSEYNRFMTLKAKIKYIEGDEITITTNQRNKHNIANTSKVGVLNEARLYTKDRYNNQCIDMNYLKKRMKNAINKYLTYWVEGDLQKNEYVIHVNIGTQNLDMLTKEI